MDGYNFTGRTRKVLALSRDEATRLHHEYVGTEHILLGLIREGEGVAFEVLQRLDADLTGIVETIDRTVKRGRTDVSVGPDLPYTSRAKKVLELAMAEARELNHSYVGTEHLLLGLLREEKGIAAQVLVEFGVTLAKARAATVTLLGSEAAPRHSERIGGVAAEMVGRSAERSNDVDPRSPWATLVRWYSAFNTRDLELMGQIWSRSARATCIDPIGGIVSGWADIVEWYRRQFAHSARVTIEVDDVLLSEAGIVASIVGLETRTVEREGRSVRFPVQTTRIVRHDGAEWHVLHHHGSIADPELLRAYQDLVS